MGLRTNDLFVNPAINHLRLSVSSTDPVPNVGGGGSYSQIYHVPFGGNLVALYNGTRWNLLGSTAIWNLSGLTANVPADLFLFDTGGTVSPEIVSWSNATTRAVALVLQDGVWVKSGAPTRRYIGTIYARSANTITYQNGGSSNTARCDLWNANNRVMTSLSGGAPWSAGGLSVDATNTWQPYIPTSKCELIVGLPWLESVVGRESIMVNLNGANSGWAGIGWDTTSGTNESPQITGVAGAPQIIAEASVIPATAGPHYISWMIRANSTAVKYFWQDSGYSGSFRCDYYY